VALKNTKFVIGIGVSSGALDAVKSFVQNCAQVQHAAFAIMMHGAQEHFEELQDWFSTQLSITFQVAKNGQDIVEGWVYLVPRNHEMILANGRFFLAHTPHSCHHLFPVNHFFRSMARDLRERAVAVVLSGSGCDGALGIREVAQRGGLAVCQDSESAVFPSMPNAAMATGCVHLSGEPHLLPAKIQDYLGNLESRDYLPLEQNHVLDKIFNLLQAKSEIDFHFYKNSTIFRRLNRRMALRHCISIAEYHDIIAGNELELEALIQDLLIGVTEFFRDKEAFRILKEEVLPVLLQRAFKEERPLRIWIPGCSIGAEVYSIAMVTRELLAHLHLDVSVKIFATDVDQNALKVASKGIYSVDRLAGVPKELLHKYFFQVAPGRMQVDPELRKSIVYSFHDLLSSPPFTRMDLVCCRNLLIYFNADAQQQAISSFYFSLLQNGVLFLGPSEITGDLDMEFEQLNHTWKIFKKRSNIQLPLKNRYLIGNRRYYKTGVEMSPVSSDIFDEQHPLLSSYDQLLDAYMPDGLLIDDNWEIIHLFGSIKRFLRLTGRMQTNLLEQVPVAFKLALSSAMETAKEQLRIVSLNSVQLEVDGNAVTVLLRIRPLVPDRTGRKLFFVSIEQTGGAVGVDKSDNLDSSAAGEMLPFKLEDATNHRIENLEQELFRTKGTLQSTVEELEASNEELQSTNEELLASNEELQSTNEELHSVNEELYVVNAEYEKKIAELKLANNDINNLIRSMDIGTLFLDCDQNIRLFSPVAGVLFNLLPQDIGRPLSHFRNNLQGFDGIELQTQQVLQTRKPFLAELQAEDGTFYQKKILPYVLEDGEIGGVVITLVDISERYLMETALRDSEKKYRDLFSVMEDAFALCEVSSEHNGSLDDFVYLEVNDAWMSHFGAHSVNSVNSVNSVKSENVANGGTSNTASEVEGKSHQELFGEKDPFWVQTYAKVARGGDPIHFEHFHEATSRHYRVHVFSPKLNQFALLYSDITEKLQIETRNAHAQKMQAIGRLAGGIAHDFNNQLSGIIGFAECLQEEWNGGEEVSEYLRHILDNANRCADLTQNLMVFAHKSRTGNDTVLVTKLIQDLVALCSRSFEKNIEMQAIIPPNEMYVKGDSAQLHNLFLNLALNAQDAMPNGGRLQIALEQKHVQHCGDLECFPQADVGDYIIVEVADSGIGMEKEVCERIFEPFFTTKSDSRGLGMGLATAYATITAHEGDIAVHSEPGKGTTFKILIPAILKQGNASNSTAPVIHSPTMAKFGAGYCLLVVDDEQTVRNLVRHQLEKVGFEVITAEDGVDGYEKYCANMQKVDLILLDMIMPRQNGPETLMKIRDLSKDVRVLIVSGYNLEKQFKSVMEHGVNGYLQKPFQRHELFDKIKSILQIEL
jgi:two-component system, chemotaxis family, CheB/CheR fusion protein